MFYCRDGNSDRKTNYQNYSIYMDFNLTEEQLMIQQAARDFAQAELLPGVIERDEHSKFPTEQVKMMGEL